MSGALQRRFLRIAHKLRDRWRRWRKTPLEGVSMIARDLDGRVLLVRHSYGPRAWRGPTRCPFRRIHIDEMRSLLELWSSGQE